MLKQYETHYHEIEKSHWWNCSRRDIIIKIITKIQTKAEVKILDIGCSTGELIKDLKKLNNVKTYGIDKSTDAIKACKDEGITCVTLMDGCDLNFDDNYFDVIIASDCLEHIENDRKALKEWYRVMKKNGTIIIFVPAHMFLWSTIDYLSSHKRRYTRKELKIKIEDSGFRINRLSFWNILMFFPISIYRLTESLFSNKDKNKSNQLKIPNEFLNKSLKSLLKLENYLLLNYNSPIGVSIFSICQKK